MQGSNLDNIPPIPNQNSNRSSLEPTVVKTDIGSKDGQNKCPKCGATDISLNVNNGKLRCNFCRHEFEAEKVAGLDIDINQLQGKVLGSGAQDIIALAEDVVTFKCSSCGAEVVVDTSSSTQARCHWCRNTLSVNQQIPNGSIPDVVLPFNVKKEEAKIQIEHFVGKRKFFAHPKFKKEFTTDNIMGVYFPYMIVNVNSHANFSGEGEHLARSYVEEHNDRRVTYYDADLYQIEREFDLAINGLTIESNTDRLNNISNEKTNNVINAIMPFDIENCVKYNSNYLKGYTSERRDINIEMLQPIIEVQAKDVARFSCNETLTYYDRGVDWSSQSFDIKGTMWTSAYLPVWLYSYQQVNGDNKVLHYVAVNARTKETMGSVPIHIPKLLGVSFLVEILGFFAMLNLDFEYDWIFLFSGILYFFIIFNRYRNKSARHKYETETKTEMSNLRKSDRFIEQRKGLTSSWMLGANNEFVHGQDLGSKLMKSMALQNPSNEDINKKEGNL